MPPRCQAPDEAPPLRLAASFLTGGRRFQDLRPDPAARILRDLARDGEAKTKPARGCAGTAIEFFENFVFFTRRETRSVIGYGKDKV